MAAATQRPVYVCGRCRRLYIQKVHAKTCCTSEAQVEMALVVLKRKEDELLDLLERRLAELRADALDVLRRR